MKTFAILTLIILFAAGTAYSRPLEIRKKAGKYDVEVKITKNPIIVGDNEIEIKIKGDEGRYVTDATVLVNYYMPPMPRMAPMNYRIDARRREDRYTAPMNFIMAGPWYIRIIIDHAGKISTAKFNIDAQ